MSLEIKTIDKILIFFIHSEPTLELSQQITVKAQEEFAQNKLLEGLVLDLQNHDLVHKVFKSLTPLGLTLKKTKKQLYIRSAEKRIHKLIRSEGMDDVMKPLFMLDEILKKSISPTPENHSFDVNFINPFIEGTIHVLDVQAQTKAVAERPLLKGPDTLKYQTDIAGIIEINTSGFKGGIAICFPESVFLAIMSKMLGEDYREITSDLEDGAAEILNIIFGHAKTILNGKGHTFDKALPTILRAPNIALHHINPRGSIVLPFQTEAGAFCMEIRTQAS